MLTLALVSRLDITRFSENFVSDGQVLVWQAILSGKKPFTIE